jgi:uncharacterized protein (DUF1330 family)
LALKLRALAAMALPLPPKITQKGSCETMVVTVVALVTVREDRPVDLAAYLEATTPLLAKAGARIVKRFKVNEVVAGRNPAQTVVIVEYPDRAAVDLVFGSLEYQRIIPYRDRAFSDYHVSVVEG